MANGQSASSPSPPHYECALPLTLAWCQGKLDYVSRRSPECFIIPELAG